MTADVLKKQNNFNNRYAQYFKLIYFTYLYKLIIV